MRGTAITKYLKYQLIICSIAIVLLPSASIITLASDPVIQNLTPIDDIYIQQDFPDNNTGNNPFMDVRNTLNAGNEPGWAYDALIRFEAPIIPTNAKNLKATLNIYFDSWNATNSAGRALSLYKIESEWNESAVTWNQQPTYSSELSGQSIVLDNPGWMSWNVTNDILGYLQGNPSFYGWKITDETDWGLPDIPVTIFRTKEYGGATIPFLEISYDLATITVQSPNGGELWYKGDTYSITWESSNIGNSIDIILTNTDNPSNSFVIITNLENQGSYSWTIQENISTGKKYKIKIQDSNNQSVYDESNQPFSISNPFISIDSPEGGEYWYKGLEYNILWSSGNAGSEVTIKLLNDTNISLIIGEHIPNYGSYKWKIPSTQKNGAKYKIQINSTSKPSLTDTSNKFFTITQKPEVSITIPDGGEKWYRSNRHRIQWTAVNLGEYVKIELYKSNKFQYIIKDKATNNGSYYWSIPQNQTNGTEYKIKISSLLDTNIYDFTEGNFSISLRPEITVTTPTSGMIWYKSDTHYINWTSRYAGNWVKIILQRNTVEEVLSWNSSNTGQYQWIISNSLQPSSVYEIIIIPLLDESFEYTSNSFSIEDTPTITALTQQSSSSWYRGEEYSIRWSSINAGDYVRVLLYKNDTLFFTIVQQTQNDGEYLWKIPDDFDPYEYYRIKIESTTKTSAYAFCAGYFIVKETWIQQWWWACGILIIGTLSAIPGVFITRGKRKKNMMHIDEKKSDILRLITSLQTNIE
jgi:hypothetical protein